MPAFFVLAFAVLAFLLASLAGEPLPPSHRGPAAAGDEATAEELSEELGIPLLPSGSVDLPALNQALYDQAVNASMTRYRYVFPKPIPAEAKIDLFIPAIAFAGPVVFNYAPAMAAFHKGGVWALLGGGLIVGKGMLVGLANTQVAMRAKLSHKVSKELEVLNQIPGASRYMLLAGSRMNTRLGVAVHGEMTAMVMVETKEPLRIDPSSEWYKRLGAPREVREDAPERIRFTLEVAGERRGVQWDVPLNAASEIALPEAVLKSWRAETQIKGIKKAGVNVVASLVSPDGVETPMGIAFSGVKEVKTLIGITFWDHLRRGVRSRLAKLFGKPAPEDEPRKLDVTITELGSDPEEESPDGEAPGPAAECGGVFTLGALAGA